MHAVRSPASHSRSPEWTGGSLCAIAFAPVYRKPLMKLDLSRSADRVPAYPCRARPADHTDEAAAVVTARFRLCGPSSSLIGRPKGVTAGHMLLPRPEHSDGLKAMVDEADEGHMLLSDPSMPQADSSPNVSTQSDAHIGSTELRRLDLSSPFTLVAQGLPSGHADRRSGFAAPHAAHLIRWPAALIRWDLS